MSPRARSARERYGNYIMSQFNNKDFLKLRNIIPASERDDDDPQTPEDVNTFGMVWFRELIAAESHRDSMRTFPTMADTIVDVEDFHAMKLICERIAKENEDVHLESFEEDDNPDLPEPDGRDGRGDPEYKHKVV